jgi:hypothetical protein
VEFGIEVRSSMVVEWMMRSAWFEERRIDGGGGLGRFLEGEVRGTAVESESYELSE